MSDWNERLFIYIRDDKLNTGNNIASAQDPDTGGAETFGKVWLSADGQLPIEWYAANTLATDGMKNGYELALDNPPWGFVYRSSDGWTWETSLADMGIQVIQQ